MCVLSAQSVDRFALSFCLCITIPVHGLIVAKSRDRRCPSFPVAWPRRRVREPDPPRWPEDATSSPRCGGTTGVFGELAPACAGSGDPRPRLSPRRRTGRLWTADGRRRRDHSPRQPLWKGHATARLRWIGSLLVPLEAHATGRCDVPPTPQLCRLQTIMTPWVRTSQHKTNWNTVLAALDNARFYPPLFSGRVWSVITSELHDLHTVYQSHSAVPDMCMHKEIL